MHFNVSRIIAVHGCKGGVGKSTVAAGLALSLRAKGCSVGLCDLDICGPNTPSLLGIEESYVKWRKVTLEDSSIEYDDRDNQSLNSSCKADHSCCGDSFSCVSDSFTDVAFDRAEPATTSLMEPKEAHGIKVMSFAFIKSKEELGYAAFRGPVLDQISTELVLKTDWGPLDYLVLDLPPGTSDVIISLIEEIPVSGMVAVSTPHHLSVKDTTKSVNLFRDQEIPLLCLVENMSYFTCDGCEKQHKLFGPSQLEPIYKSLGAGHFVCIPTVIYGDEFVDSLMANGDFRQKFDDIAKIIMENPATNLSGNSHNLINRNTQSPNTRQLASCSNEIEW